MRIEGDERTRLRPRREKLDDHCAGTRLILKLSETRV